MLYANDSPGALLAMEQMRIGGYDYDEDVSPCPMCESEMYDCLYIAPDDSVIGCDQCIRREYTI